MSNGIISAAGQEGYTPWELASFDGDPQMARQIANAKINLPTIEQITAIQEQARQEGYEAGRTEGYAHGVQEAARETARLRNIADTFSTAVAQADDAISEQLLDLALDFARAILKSSLEVRPELVIPIIREAVRYLPAMQQPALLYLHPRDSALVRERMGDELATIGWQLADDSALEPGSCKVETPSNQIDASLHTRWQRLAASLGKDSNWLATS